jgi:hypothetical protein
MLVEKYEPGDVKALAKTIIELNKEKERLMAELKQSKQVAEILQINADLMQKIKILEDAAQEQPHTRNDNNKIECSGMFQ